MIYQTIIFAFITLCPAIIFAENATKTVIGVEIYYETRCGDSIRFIEQQLLPSYAALKDHLDITFIPYGKATHKYDESTGAWEFSCQHGPLECAGNKAQACGLDAIKKHEATENQQFYSVNFVGCIMKAGHDEILPVENCARSANLKEETVTQILNCKNNDTIADVLLVAHGEKTKTLNPSLSFVPTVVINKEYPSDQGNYIRNNFVKSICDRLPTTEVKPQICTA
ncbi:hypothetical protein HCN44_009745 [Aphidius gifuensis]|uniref:Odorant-binding protein n=1 Tax=Aphidius gifuensis TaxID=684658 RepID=A0A834Y800_APHGI|nr:GILT-like protein 1 [Aphidius gifuensis]KAF7998347.1 hypothetical protein HCN44_009745 [Aphidius gifuensis]